MSGISRQSEKPRGIPDTCCVLQAVGNQLSTKSEKNEVWGGEHAEDVLKISTKLMVVPDRE